jgi:Transglutaminase-like superfamily
MTTLDFYLKPGPMTTAGDYIDVLRTLPRDLPGLARAIHTNQIHEYMLAGYGVTVPEERKRESHLRRLDHMLACMKARDPRPLSVPREPAQRSIGVCRHFTVLLVAALRDQGIPARTRVGFGSYFNPGKYEDHWVGEYWNAKEKRWILVDAQLDEVQGSFLKIDFDPLDVPRDRFIVAHDAWQRCRAGEWDAGNFGISVVPLHGLWFIAGDLVRDAAALNGVESLPWDVWGGMLGAQAALSPDQLAFFDRLAVLTAAPDEHAQELRALYDDERLRIGKTVWNDRTQANEKIDEPPTGVPLA